MRFIPLATGIAPEKPKNLVFFEIKPGLRGGQVLHFHWVLAQGGHISSAIHFSAMEREFDEHLLKASSLF